MLALIMSKESNKWCLPEIMSPGTMQHRLQVQGGLLGEVRLKDQPEKGRLRCMEQHFRAREQYM